MFSYKRAIGGLKAKVIGEQFENLIEFHAKRFGASVTRIPSGCRWVSSVRAIPVQTPFDFFICYRGKSLSVDTKTVNNLTFSKSKIKEHQADELLKIEKQGLLAGYLIWFRLSGDIVFFKASQLKALQNGCSLKAIDGIGVGSAKQLNFEALFDETKQQVVF